MYQLEQIKPSILLLKNPPHAMCSFESFGIGRVPTMFEQHMCTSGEFLLEMHCLRLDFKYKKD
jgi:hypothetical protein